MPAATRLALSSVAGSSPPGSTRMTARPDAGGAPGDGGADHPAAHDDDVLRPRRAPFAGITRIRFDGRRRLASLSARARAPVLFTSCARLRRRAARLRSAAIRRRPPVRGCGMHGSTLTTCARGWPTPGSTCAPTRGGPRATWPTFLDAVLARRGGHRPAAGEGPRGGRGARAARGVRGRVRQARGAARGQRPGRRRPRGRRGRAAPRPGRPAGAGGAADPRAGAGDRAVAATAPEQAAAAGDEDGVDYFCAGPVWATPTKPGRPGTGTGAAAARRRARRRPGRGSRSAGSASTGWTRCSRRARRGWSWCARSPRRTTRARPRPRFAARLRA